MAVGDSNVRQLSTGDSYTPSGSLRELITAIRLETGVTLEMRPSGQSAWVDISPTSETSTDAVAQSPLIQQNPGYVLDSSVTIRATGSSGDALISTLDVSTGTAPAPPPTPSLPGQVMGLASTSIQAPQATVTWTAVSGAISYEVTVNGATTTGLTATTRSFAVTAGTVYTVTVRARNSAGLGAASTALTFTATAVPTGPTHEFSILAGGSGNSIGLNTPGGWGSVTSGTATYTPPGGSERTIVMARSLGDNFVFTLSDQNTPYAEFPSRIVATYQSNSITFNRPASGGNVPRNIGSGTRIDYTPEGSITIGDVFVTGRTIEFDLYY